MALLIATMPLPSNLRSALFTESPAEPDPGTGVREIVHLCWKQRLGPVEIVD